MSGKGELEGFHRRFDNGIDFGRPGLGLGALIEEASLLEHRAEYIRKQTAIRIAQLDGPRLFARQGLRIDVLCQRVR